MKQKNLCCTLIGLMVGLVSVADEAQLPAGYEAVPYIESTGTQWINPDYNLAADTKIEAEFSHLKWGAKANVTLFGGSLWGNGSAILNMRESEAAGLIGYLGATTVTFAYSYANEDRCTIVAVSSGNEDSVFTNTTTGASTKFTAGTISNASALGKAFHIFKPAAKSVSDGYNSSYRLYSMKLSDGGELKRDLVPARRLIDGELGLYDRASNNFYPNAGTGKFRTEGTTGHRLTYIRSNGNQKIDGFWTTTNTGYQFDFWFGDWKMLDANGGACVYLGCGTWGNGWLINSNNGQAKNLNYFGFNGNVNLVPNGNMGNETYYFHLNNADGSTSIAKEGVTLKQNDANGNLVGASGKSLSLFGLAATGTGQIVGTYGYSKYSFYGIKVTDTVSHEFVPYLQPDGETAGLADVAANPVVFKPGTSNFTDHGLAYDLVEGAAQFSVGTLTAADWRALNSGAVTYSTFEKVSGCVLNTAAVANFNTAVKVSAGTWSLTNGTAAVQSVPALTLKGGVTLAFDVVDGASDAIVVQTGVTLEDASGTPIRIALAPSNVLATMWADGIPLIVGGFEAGDEQYFALTDNFGMDDLTLVVADGALVVKNVNNTSPVIARWQQVGGSWQWVCFNAAGQVLEGVAPLADVTMLTVESGTPFTCTAMPGCQRIVFNPSATSGKFELSDDGDWSGLDLSKVQTGAKIDLMGHALKFPATGTADALTVYDSVGTGTLQFVVADGVTDACATGITFDASVVAFEKLGTGEFTADARFDNKAITVAAGTWSTADGTARTTVYSALTLAGGTTLKTDAADEIRPTVLTLNGTEENPIAVVTTGTAPVEEMPLLVNESITPADRTKFATDAALTVEPGRILHFTQILPEGYVMLPSVETLGGASAAYVDTGIGSHQEVRVCYWNNAGRDYDDRPVLAATFMPVRTASAENGNAYFGSLNVSGFLGGSMALRMDSGKLQSVFLNNNTYWYNAKASDGLTDTGFTPVAGTIYTVTLRADLEWGRTTIADETGAYLSGQDERAHYHNLGNAQWPSSNTFLQNTILIGRASSGSDVTGGAAARYYSVVLTYGVDGVGSGRTTRTYYPALETATGRVGFYCTGAQRAFLPAQGGDFGYLRGSVAEGTLFVRDGLLAPGYSYLNNDSSMGIGAFSALEKTGPNALRIKAGYTTALTAVNLKEGTLDFTDGAQGTHKLGALTLAGGTTIKMDVVSTTMSDAIEVSAPITYVGVAAETPVEIVLQGDITADLTLITGEQLTEADLPNFRIAETCAKPGYVLRVKDGNLEYASDRRPDKMVWVNGRWEIQNAHGDPLTGIPPDPLITTVHMPSPAQSVTEPVEVKTIRAAAGNTIELDADTDWSGLPFDRFGALTVDLKGHNLTLLGNGVATVNEVTFTNSTETVATLTACVPQGKAQKSWTYRVSGAIRLVKTGAGSLSLGTNTSPFTGGLVVREGSVNSNNYGNSREFGAANGEIYIGNGAEMQLGRMINFQDYQFVLSNGTLKATGDKGLDDWESSYWNSPLVANVRLDADATIDFSTKYYGFRNASHAPATLDLAGHTLDLTFTTGYIDNLTVLNGGTIRLLAGTVEVYNQGVGLSAPDTCFEMYGTFQPRKDITIGDYICHVTAAGSWPSDAYCNKLCVARTFKTYTEYFYGCTLLDGATLDLSNQPLEWSVKSRCGARAGRDVLSFADNATINVDLGSRKVHSGDLIVSWSGAKPANADTLKFVDPTGKCGFFVTDTGLEVRRGFAIFVR